VNNDILPFPFDWQFQLAPTHQKMQFCTQHSTALRQHPTASQMPQSNFWGGIHTKKQALGH
jgi:hypothetical protein